MRVCSRLSVVDPSTFTPPKSAAPDGGVFCSEQHALLFSLLFHPALLFFRLLKRHKFPLS